MVTGILSSCIVDKDKRCSEGEVYVEETSGGIKSGVCVCAPGATPNANKLGCTACGSHETVQNGKCVCEVGYSASGDAGVCEKASIGADCTGNDSCSDPFPYCATDGDEHYCSVQHCDANSCPTGYACESGDAGFCKKLPKGLGASCMSNDDCAAGAAKYCDTVMTHACILTGCANGDVKCPGYYGCCDLNALVAGLSVCTPPSGLTDGKCPYGTLVNP